MRVTPRSGSGRAQIGVAIAEETPELTLSVAWRIFWLHTMAGLIVSAIIGLFSALVSRGGIALRLIGAAVVTRNGAPASGARARLRAILGWVPVLAASATLFAGHSPLLTLTPPASQFYAVRVVQFLPVFFPSEPTIVVTRVAIITVALAVFAIGVIAAVIEPERGLQGSPRRHLVGATLVSSPPHPVNAERWRVATGVFHAALEHPPGRRLAFLAEACREDESLRADVEALLAGDERADAAGDPLAVDPARELFLDAPTLDVATRTRSASAAAPATPMEGRHFGAYRILHEVGSGGMGSVYLADRVDEAFHQRVAIKIVRPEFADAAITGRFRQEREILAALDHPTIARLIDGGSTDEGVPYFVMEYADGQPIDTWCDRHKADVTRLELFRAVCSGVQHAHDHLVLHRDLVNIFVTADGGVKLLDFGSPSCWPNPLSWGSTNTGTDMRVMTPRYASSEQVRGEPLSVTSDVYALGVVLYELLTGHWPYRTQSRLLHEVTRAICEEEPTVPSAVLDEVEQAPSDTAAMHPLTPEMISAVREGAPARLRRRLEGDLDTILLKALAKDPARRYRSVEQFSEDVRRHLEGMPVAAREDSYWYRASKFVRRHPVGVAAAILIAIAQQFSFMTTVWEFRVKVPAAAAAGAAVDVRPELVAYTYLVLALLVGAAYVSRAQTVRVAGSIVGGAIFSTFVTVVPISMGWRRFVPMEHSVQALWLLCAICIPFGAILALASWRIARRFGWRGLAAFVIVASIGAPIREQLYLSTAHLMVVAPGAVPKIAYTLSWACALLLSHSIMRLIAGRAVDDRLARRRWSNP